MKQFLKFIVSIIVIAIMICTVYFLTQNASKYVDNLSGDNINVFINQSSGENNSQVNQNENLETDNPNNSGEDLNSENIINEMSSGDYTISGEVINDNVSEENESGNSIYTNQKIEQKVNDIKELENQNKTANVTKTMEDSVGLDIMGIKNKDIFQTFNLSEITVTVQIAGTMVYIIPNSDFIDDAQYHFDKNGNLVLYVRELTGVGGEMRYYYENGKFLKEEKLIEEGIEIESDDTLEILQRAKLVYEKYMK